MYRPPDVPANGALWDNTEDEYLELANLGSTNVPLFDPRPPLTPGASATRCASPSHQPVHHRRRTAARRQLRSHCPAGSCCRLPRQYGLATETRLFGPSPANSPTTATALNSSNLTSSASTAPTTSLPASWWTRSPIATNCPGRGRRRHRLFPPAPGRERLRNDPANWVAASPTPRRLPPGHAPLITRQPATWMCALVPRELLRRGQRPRLPAIPVAVQRQEPPGDELAHPVPARGTTTNAGLYQVTVWNQTRAVTSDPARLRVGDPPEILRQPASLEAAAGGTAVFSIIAAAPHRFVTSGARTPSPRRRRPAHLDPFVAPAW